MAKISVVTPTIRREGLFLVKKALDGQTFRDFEWLIGSSFDPEVGKWVKDDNVGGLYTLNRVYNQLFRASEGELIVSLQDLTYIKPDALQRFWDHYEYEPGMIVSGMGDKYEDETWTKKTWADPRKPGVCGYSGVEWNLTACPRQAIVDAGGFDEDLDFMFYGLGEFQLDHRLSEMGYSFLADPKIESYSLGHGRVPDWDEKNGIDNGSWIPYKKRVIELKNSKRWPIIGKL